jgi:site-specific recombinase XerD
MASVKFILDKPQSGVSESKQRETSIYAIVRKGDERAKVNIGKKILPKYWNQKSVESHYRKNCTGSPEKNTELKRIKDEVEGEIELRLKKAAVTIDDIKDIIKSKLKAIITSKESPNILIPFIRSIIARGSKHGKKLSLGTIKSYGTTLNHLLSFNSDIDFKDINSAFYNDFNDFMNKLNLAPNTKGRHIKTIKSFLNEANEEGISNITEHKKKTFKVVKEDVETIYLTRDEVDLIYNLDLSENKKLDRVRDLFVIGANTALRFSDFTRIKPENIKDGILEIRTQKTDEVVCIPLHWQVNEILTKYGNNLPRAISNQKMNDYLKELGRLAKINTMVMVNGELRIKYELISSHTCRRSAATNMFLADIPAISIMKLTGHRTDRSFMKYIKMTSWQNAVKLKEHSFFQRPLKAV